MADHDPTTWSTSRRTFIAGAAMSAAAALGFALPTAWPNATAPKLPQRTKLRIARLQWGICTAALSVGAAKGIYDKYNLDVEFVNYVLGFKSPTAEMIFAPQQGKADAVAAMVFNFLRPLAEDGLKLKFVTSVHGGCVRVVGSQKAGVTTLESLRGKVLAVPGELRGEDAVQLFPALLKSWGLRPEKDIFFRWGPDRLNPEVVRAGEAHAYMQVDPIIFKAQRENPDLVEIINNQTGPFANRTCCAVLATEEYAAKNALALTALHFAVAEAAEYMVAHPEEAAAIYASETHIAEEDIVGTLKRMENHHHPVNHDLQADIAFQARALRDIGGFANNELDTDVFAKRVTARLVC